MVPENGAGCSTNCVVSEQGLEGRYERLLSQSSRALGSGPEGRWFESSRPDQNSKKCPWEEFDTLGLIHRASVPSNPHSVWGQIAPLQFPPVEDQSLQQLRRGDLADTILTRKCCTSVELGRKRQVERELRRRGSAVRLVRIAFSYALRVTSDDADEVAGFRTLGRLGSNSQNRQERAVSARIRASWSLGCRW